MKRRQWFNDTTVFVDLVMVTRIRDDHRGELTTTRPIKIPVLLAWLLAWYWTRPKRPTLGQRVKSYYERAAVWVALVLLGVARWKSISVLL